MISLKLETNSFIIQHIYPHKFPQILLQLYRNPHLDSRLQFDYLINNIRKKRRYSKWLKPEKLKNVELVKEYYGFSYEKAKDALAILSEDQLAYIRDKLNQGGVNNGDRNRKHGGVHVGEGR